MRCALSMLVVLLSLACTPLSVVDVEPVDGVCPAPQSAPLPLVGIEVSNGTGARVLCHVGQIGPGLWRWEGLDPVEPDAVPPALALPDVRAGQVSIECMIAGVSGMVRFTANVTPD